LIQSGFDVLHGCFLPGEGVGIYLFSDWKPGISLAFCMADVPAKPGAGRVSSETIMHRMKGMICKSQEEEENSEFATGCQQRNLPSLLPKAPNSNDANPPILLHERESLTFSQDWA